LLDVAIVERSENRAPVAKVLVDRADTNARDFGDAVRCDAIDAVAF